MKKVEKELAEVKYSASGKDKAGKRIALSAIGILALDDLGGCCYCSL